MTYQDSLRIADHAVYLADSTRIADRAIELHQSTLSTVNSIAQNSSFASFWSSVLLIAVLIALVVGVGLASAKISKGKI